MNGGRVYFLGAAIVLLPVTMFSACSSTPKAGIELAGAWEGLYKWDRGSTYAVTLLIDPKSITGTKTVKFRALETVNGCLVHVDGVFQPDSRGIQLDEVTSSCEQFILTGLYAGRLDANAKSMNLVWGPDEEGAIDETTQGTLELAKLGPNPPAALP
jgi:hypothetical protein